MNKTQGQTEIARHALQRAMRDALGIREEGILPHSEGACETSRPAEIRPIGKPETPQAPENLRTGAKQGQVGDATSQNSRVDSGQEELLITGAEQGPSEAKPPHSLRQERTGNGGSTPPKQYRFQPGKSGNPGGRPKNAFNRLLRQILAADDHKYAKQVVESLVKHACKGNQTALRELFARVEPEVGGATRP